MQFPQISDSKKQELQRLIQTFQKEADQFHPTTFSLEYLNIGRAPENRIFARPNHAISLWQYYGVVSDEASVNRMLLDISSESKKFGVPGAELSCVGVIEGAGTELFVRMASRAGSLFDQEQAFVIKSRLLDEIIKSLKVEENQKPVSIANDNPLAIWLNYLLYYLSITNPGRERQKKISPDPFSLSLLALEQLDREDNIGKIDSAVGSLTSKKFSVALSYSAKYREYVSQIAEQLKQRLGSELVFYDKDHESLLAQPNLDVILQGIYSRQSRLCVAFTSECYLDKDWCQVEWRAMRDHLKSGNSDRLMIIRFDDCTVEGLLGLDGYIDARNRAPTEITELILERLGKTRA